MRIALMTNNYKPFMGGVPISIERLKCSLEELGHEVTVFAPSYENQQEEEGVVRYGNLINHFIAGSVVPNPFDSVIEAEFIEKQFDIIHVHHPFLIGNVALRLSRKYEIPLTFTYHTQYEQYLYSYARVLSPLGKLMPLYLRYFMKRCDYVFAPTKGMQEYLHDTCHVPYEKMDILPTGLPKEHYMVSEEEKTFVRTQYQAEKIPIFISVSRMAKEKNVAFLIKSIARVREMYSKPFKVLLVGDGPDMAEYERLSVKLELTDVIHFTGKLDNEKLAPYFAAADAFLFASKTETQGIVVLEAFAGRNPVIALDATGVRDLVTEGVNGWLCEEDEELFAQNILCFLREHESFSDSGSIQQLAENAYETAMQFREGAVATKAVSIYNKIIASYQCRKMMQNIHNRMKNIWKIVNITF